MKALSLLRPVLLAVQFFTRIPLPAWLADRVGFSPAAMRAAFAHLPAMGWLVGIWAALACMAVRALWGTSVMMQTAPVLVYMLAAVLSTAATLWLTGCFHEDGLADVADGLGGFVDAERALHIMKDPRVGNYAVCTMVLAFALKTCLLTALAALYWQGLLCMLVTAHVLSRFFPLVLAHALPHVALEGQSKTQQAAGTIERIRLWVAALWCAPLVAVCGWAEKGGLLMLMLVCAALAAGLVALHMGRWFKRRLHGFTGDCLGATQQICELACYAAALTVLAHGGLAF